MRGMVLAALLWAQGAAACETALVLAIDVSASVDEAEYRLQVDGLADALLDPEVTESLIRGQSALLTFQWSGAGEQAPIGGWERMTDLAAIRAYAAQVRAAPRAFVQSVTAPGDALQFALAQFAAVPDCVHPVVDVSGDGVANSGSDLRLARAAAEQQGVMVNGLAIELMGIAMTIYFERSLITTDGFVMTARGHRDYPEAIRLKLIRELAQAVG
jgi:Ca-activated chloride channel homolog